MLLPTLEYFLSENCQSKANNLSHPDFQTLYVRKCPVYFDDSDGVRRVIPEKVITVANVTSHHPGRGAFTRLVADLLARDLAIYVECVHDPRFSNKLLTMGFQLTNHNCFLLNHQDRVLPIPEIL